MKQVGQRSDRSMSTPSTDFIFRNPVRRLLWVAGGLVFYAQLTIGLLRNFEIYSADGTRPVSAWITLANLAWNAPELGAPLDPARTCAHQLSNMRFHRASIVTASERV
jgi:hypothetical protein